MNSIKRTLYIGGVLMLGALFSSCSSNTTPQQTSGASAYKPQPPAQQTTLPVHYQTASYVVGQPDAEKMGEEATIRVGARITSTQGPQPLWDIVKRLVALKGMNVSWASDVDRDVLVDVDINADDDFYEAIDNLLRQVDYYHEVKGNTIIVKFRETRQFQIAMPFVKHNYKTSVGGDILGTSGEGQISGVIGLDSNDNQFDLWSKIAENLDTILEVWEIKQQEDIAAENETVKIEEAEDASAEEGEEEKLEKVIGGRKHGENTKGYYVIDKPVGIITVTAPRPVLEKVDSYIANLKKRLYKQVAIEAKIIEVQLDKESNIGIDWSSVMKNFGLLSGTLTFGADGQVYPYLRNNPLIGDRIYTDHHGNRTYPGEGGLDEYFTGPRSKGYMDEEGNWVTTQYAGAAFYNAINPGSFISKIMLNNANFDLFINALKEEGQTKILSNPKISVMNGQPAMISVGQNRTYIDSIETTVDDGIITYDVSTSSLLAGVGMAITANVLDDKEIIMNLVPITSELVGGIIAYEEVGAQGGKIGLPVMNVREMSTTVKVRDGEMLIIGGLISDAESHEEDFIPGLGSIPVVKYLFGKETKRKRKRELIILLRPKII